MFFAVVVVPCPTVQLIAEGSGEDEEADTQLRRDAVDGYVDLLDTPAVPDQVPRTANAARLAWEGPITIHSVLGRCRPTMLCTLCSIFVVVVFLYFVYGMVCAVGRPTVGETTARCIGVVSRGGGCCLELRVPFFLSARCTERARSCARRGLLLEADTRAPSFEIALLLSILRKRFDAVTIPCPPSLYMFPLFWPSVPVRVLWWTLGQAVDAGDGLGSGRVRVPGVVAGRAPRGMHQAVRRRVGAVLPGSPHVWLCRDGAHEAVGAVRVRAGSVFCFVFCSAVKKRWLVFVFAVLHTA